MSTLSDDIILSAIAELKESNDSKVKVRHLANALGVTPKTLYSDRYKHLLEYCKPGVRINQDNNSLLSELMRTKNLLKKTQEDFDKLQSSLEEEKFEIKRNTLKELFFDSALALDYERIRQEINGKTEQLNTKVEANTTLKIENDKLKSKIQKLKDSINKMGKGSNNIEFTFFTPDLLLANKAYSETKKLSSWLEKYKDSCVKEALDIINKEFEKVIIHVSNFNCKTEDICKTVNYESGRYAVLHTALFNAQQRQSIISEFKNKNIKLYCVYTLSTSAVSKFFRRQQQLPIEDSLIDSIDKQFQAPNFDEGFADIYSKAIKHDN